MYRLLLLLLVLFSTPLLASAQSCLEFSNSRFECTPLAGGRTGFRFDFDLTNYSDCRVTTATVRALGPAGTDVTPLQLAFPDGLDPDSTVYDQSVIFSGPALVEGSLLRLAISLDGNGCGCADTVAIIVPGCPERCYDLTTLGVSCDTTGGGRLWRWNFNVVNGVDCNMQRLDVTPQGLPGTPTPITHLIENPFRRGDTAEVSLPLDLPSFGAAGGIVRLALQFSGSGAGCVCRDTIQLYLPACDADPGACLELVDQTVRCNGVQGWVYEPQIRNMLGCPVTSVSVMALDAPGVTVQNSARAWLPGREPGTMLSDLRLWLNGDIAPGSRLRLRVEANGTLQGCGCVDTLELEIPTCDGVEGCTTIETMAMTCEQEGDRWRVTQSFRLTNSSFVAIDSLRFVSDDFGVEFAPEGIALSTLLAPGATLENLVVTFRTPTLDRSPVRIGYIAVGRNGTTCVDTASVVLDCPPAGVEREDLWGSMTVVPNPASTQARVEIDSRQLPASAELQVVDARGVVRLWRRLERGEREIPLGLDTLPAGQYRVIVRGDGLFLSRGLTIAR